MQPLVTGSSNPKSISRESVRLIAGMVCVVLLWSSISVAGHFKSGTEPRFLNSTTARQATAEKAGQKVVERAEAAELKTGPAINRELVGGGSNAYRVTLNAGQFLKVVVEQQGIDVAITLLGQNNQQIAQVDSPNGMQGQESVSVVAESAGIYRIEIQSPDKTAATGRYEIRIEELRDATSRDRVYVAAERAFEQANQLRDQGTSESREKAARKYEESLSLWREIGDKRGEATLLNEISYFYDNLSQLPKALEFYDQAVSAWHALEDPTGEATALNFTGLAYWKLGNAEMAIGCYTRALTLSRTVGNQLLEATLLSNIGAAYTFLGKLQDAMDFLRQSLPLRRAIGDRLGEGFTLHNIGSIYRRWGNSEKALEYFGQALTQNRAAKDPQGEAINLHSLGTIHLEMGEPAKALEYYNQTLPLARAAGDRRTEAYSLSDIGTTYLKMGQSQNALEYLNQALTLQRTIGDKWGETYTLSRVGAVYTSSNDAQTALGYYQQSLQLSRAVGDRLGEANALKDIAQAERKLGNITEALADIVAALDIVESTRAQVTSQANRTSYFASMQTYYSFYIDLLMQMSRDKPGAGLDADALNAAERARARTMLEILNEARIDIRQGVDPGLLERERTLGRQLNTKSERLMRLLRDKPSAAQETGARREVDALLASYQELEAQIRTKSPRYAALTQPQPLTLKEIQQQVLDEDTLLLEYALGDEQSYLWAVTPTSIKSYKLPGRSEIDAAARRVYELLVAKADALYPESLIALSRMLLTPVADQLGHKRLLVVSDGALQYVPFGALPVLSEARSKIARELPDKNRTPKLPPLILDHEIVNVPSASVLAVLRRELGARTPAPRKVAVLADPVFASNDSRVKSRTRNEKASNDDRVHGATENGVLGFDGHRSTPEPDLNSFDRLLLSRREAESITALAANGHPLTALDFMASRSTATSSELNNYQIVHFATHSLLNNEHPELSGIVLSLVDEGGRPQDGFLRLYEIFNLKLQADLVVLSACQTALGKQIKGEGLVGLTRGFMYAGAPRVVASLWKVSDKATAELMGRFYQKMLKDGLRPAAALRDAQVSMLKERQWQAAYYWAGFVLEGEWK